MMILDSIDDIDFIEPLRLNMTDVFYHEDDSFLHQPILKYAFLLLKIEQILFDWQKKVKWLNMDQIVLGN